MRSFAVVTAAVLLIAASASMADRDSDRGVIVALEQDWLAHQSDRATLERVLASDFQHPVPPGLFLTKAQHIAWAVAHPRSRDRKARFTELEVRVFECSAIAAGIVEETDLRGRTLGRSIFTDVFVKRNGRWQAVNAQENRLSPVQVP